MSRILRGFLFVFMVATAQAQMPHEVLLLVNRNSQPSLFAANTFAAMRGIPKQNIVYLDIPESAYGDTATVTPEEFTRLIWEPANAEARKRGIDGQILAWVYSVDFPIRVKTDPYDRKQMSVGGMTFVRNKPPALTLVEDGKYFSKLFSGPNQRLKLSLPAFSLAVRRDGFEMNERMPPEVGSWQGGLGEDMPLPSMMLGYVGEKGTDVQTVIDTLARGKESDHRGGRKGIYFVMSDDVRSKCREWQYYPAVAELQERKIEANVTTNFPAGAEDVMGVLMGAEKVDPSLIKSFAPGAMAEHLTSWSAQFQKPQTKATEWLKAGATASAGAVVEPYSNPNKFPSARFFTHYISGCTMLESFYQSIACPLQSLLLGDPLAKPYAPPVTVKILGSERPGSFFTYAAQVSSLFNNALYIYSFMLDGKEIQAPSEEGSFYLRTANLSDGYHELRAVVRVQHFVQFNAHADKPIFINRMGRSLSILPSVEKIGEHNHGIKVKVEGEEQPEKLRLVCGTQVLDEKSFTPDAELVLDELVTGEGPNRIRAIAIYADGMEVSSPPVSFAIKFIQ
ncbi:MAG: hypothetical protein ABFR33_08845 [Verrucomicrobiota bacterium]